MAKLLGKEVYIMNILLIYPKFPETFWSFTYALSFIGKKAAFPPLGLLTVAAMLPKDWTKRLVDVNVESLTDKDLLWADMAFISGMAVQRESAKQIIARCNALNLTVVAGGPLFTSEPDVFKEVDHLVLDEAELSLPAFLSDLHNGSPKKVYRASGFCDLFDTPTPSWDLVNMRTIYSLSRAASDSRRSAAPVVSGSSISCNHGQKPIGKETSCQRT
jgi:radical SAM superfamily enzyme YgiQ (UPF0313 family)